MKVIHLARKPPEGTVARNALKYGTGGLNIDATRIGTSDNLNGGAYAPESNLSALPGDTREGASAGMFAPGVNARARHDGTESWRYRNGEAGDFVQPPGRWPANLILQHLPGCEKVGTKRIKGNPTSKEFHEAYGDEGDSITGFLRGVSHPGNQHSDEDGLETVEDWCCAEGCPVQALDRQSGVLKSGSVKPGYRRNATDQESGGGYMGHFGDIPLSGFGDAGGASRYFKQIGGKTPCE